MLKSKETGRSLLEMMAVLAIMAIIVLASLFLFNTLIKQYQRKDTVKTFDTIITRVKSTNLMRKRDGKIRMKDVIPGQDGTAADGSKFTLEDMGGDTFVVIKTGNQWSCRDIVEEGNYDVVSYGDVENDYQNRDKGKVFSSNSSDLKAKLEEICHSKYQYFYFSKNGSGSGKEIHNGTLSDCPAGQILAMDPNHPEKNVCCAEGNVKAGYCGKCPNDQAYDSAKDICLECNKNTDCSGNVDKKVCDTDNHKCVGCVYNNARQSCGTADKWCGEDNKCHECDETCGYYHWNGSYCERVKEAPGLGESCTADCGCQNNLICSSETCVIDTTKTCDDLLGTAVRLTAGQSCANYIHLANGCCASGLTCNGGKCLAGDGTGCPSPLLNKNASCASYAGYDNFCCDKGYTCTNGKCQCPSSNGYHASCNADCGCAEGLECESKLCVCPNYKVWDSNKRQCMCKVADNTNSDKECYERYYPNKMACPGYYYYKPKAEGTICTGSCHSCNTNGACVDRTQSWTGRTWQSKNTNCCEKSKTYTYCPIKGETAPSPCTGNKLGEVKSESSNYGCTTTTYQVDQCNGSRKNDRSSITSNGTACTGVCGRCQNGGCLTVNQITVNTFNGNCCNGTMTYCPVNEIEPTTKCTKNRISTTTTSTTCGTTTTTTDLCTNQSTNRVSPLNEGGVCGICGKCSHGTCNDHPKQNYTYYKKVSGICTKVTESFCPTNPPSDQCKMCAYKSGQVIFDSNGKTGTFTINNMCEGYYEVTMAGGGGNNLGWKTGGAFSAVFTPGSGAGFYGIIHLSQPDIKTVTVGSFSGTSSFATITCTGGERAHDTRAGAGGKFSGKYYSKSIAKDGEKGHSDYFSYTDYGDDKTRGGSSPLASIGMDWGKGADYERGHHSGQNPKVGYVKIKYIGVTP